MYICVNISFPLYTFFCLSPFLSKVEMNLWYVVERCICQYSYDAPIPRLIATLLIPKGLVLRCSTPYGNQFPCPCYRKVYILRSLENSVSASREQNSKFDEVYLLKEGFDFFRIRWWRVSGRKASASWNLVKGGSWNPVKKCLQYNGFYFLKSGQGRTLKSCQEVTSIGALFSFVKSGHGRTMKSCHEATPIWALFSFVKSGHGRTMKSCHEATPIGALFSFVKSGHGRTMKSGHEATSIGAFFPSWNQVTSEPWNPVMKRLR